MTFKWTPCVIGISALFGLAACVQTTPNWDKQFGESAQLAVARQTLNPDAANKDVPEIMDGNAAREALGRYRSSFKEPPQNNNGFVIGVGR